MTEREESQRKLGELDDLLSGPGSARRVYVDFDHTLFLSNSTEEFLANAKPAILAALILKVLAILRPWYWISREKGYFVWRDAIRVWTILILMPWTLLLFHFRAPRLFREYENKALSASLSKVPVEDVVVLSFGFSFVIRRMLSQSAYRNARLVASSIWRPVSFRKQGKMSQLSRSSLQANTERDIVITDSEKDDADLLANFRNSFHIRWPNEKTTGAHEGMYLPFYYLAKVKRTPEFFIKSTLLEEVPIIILAFLVFQPFHWSVMLGGVLLFISFLVVYEIGYHENDHVGVRYEEAPKLSDEFHQHKSYRVEPFAWFWFLAMSTLAAKILGNQRVAASLERLGMEAELSSESQLVLFVLIWGAVAFLARAVFFLFNHVPLLWRVFVFFPLHMLKYGSLLAIFPTHPAGLALLGAQVTRTWSAYAIRRCGGDEHAIVSQLIRLMFVIFLLLVLAFVVTPAQIFGAWQTWAIVAWCVVRAIPEMNRKMFHSEVLAEFVPWFGKRKI